MDRKRFGQRWYRTGDWPMALKLILHTGGIAAALAVGLTAMGYIQAAQGLSERAEAALSSDALVVTTAIDDWNAQHLTSLQSLARLPAVARLLSGKPDAMVLEDQETAGESLSALGAPGQNVESVVLIGASCKVILSNRVDDVGKTLASTRTFAQLSSRVVRRSVT